MVAPSPIHRAAISRYPSRFAPQYTIKPHLFGLTTTKLARASVILGGFGLPAAAGLLLFFGEVPRVRNDILQRIPVLGPYWRREIAPEDNPY